MQGYGSPQTGYTTPQVPYAQGYGQDSQPGNNTPYAPAYTGQINPPYTAAVPQNGTQGSFIPQTPYSPGYTSPGYQPPSAGYAQANGYPSQVNGYPQQNGYPSMGNGYPQPNGYPQQAGYPYTTGNYPQQAGYPQQGMIPQQGGYQQPQGGSAPYNPYAQMGRTQQPMQPQPDPSQGIPLNGGGYVPQKVPVRRRPFEMKDWYLIAAGILLIALFAVSTLVMKSNPLKIALMVLAAGSAAVLWIKPLTAENKRLTYSILALALCILTAVSFFMNQPRDIVTSSTETPEEVNDDLYGSPSANGGVPVIPPESSAAGEEPTPTPDTTDNLLMERLVSFFTYWSGNRQDEMLTLCAPSWQSKQENPRTSLFALLANRTPKDCTPESITGTPADTSRRVTLTSQMDRNNGKPAEKYRMTILMVMEGNEWYIDPQSLQTYESAETPDPNITPTPAPTETPAVYATTVLYYNPKGGEYYHLDPNCKIINPKFLPLGGSFTYGEIDNDAYKNLKPCNVCGAPLRP